MKRIDVMFEGESRARQIGISGPPGITFYLPAREGVHPEFSFTLGAKPLVREILELAAAGDGGDWARHLLAGVG